MALIKCSECTREISDKAMSCPHCGFPLPKQTPERSEVKTVICLDCKKEYEFKKEQCPSCGLFNSQKHLGANQESNSSYSEPIRARQQAKTQNRANYNFLFKSILFGIIALIFGGITGSVFIGLATFFVGMMASYRVDYLAKYPKKKFSFEKNIYTWKGIIVYLIIIFIIIFINNHIDARNEIAIKNKQIEDSKIINNNHLSQAKIILKTTKISDKDLIAARHHLAAITSDADGYKEAKIMLQDIKNKADEAAKRVKEEERKLAKIKEETERKQRKIKEIEDFKRETAGLSAKGKRLKEKHPGWSVEECDTISKGQIRIGMTKDQVAAAWGRPYNINKTHNAYGTQEQWVMHEMGSSYVYFDGDICTSIQN